LAQEERKQRGDKEGKKREGKGKTENGREKGIVKRMDENHNYQTVDMV